MTKEEEKTLTLVIILMTSVVVLITTVFVVIKNKKTTAPEISVPNDTIIEGVPAQTITRNKTIGTSVEGRNIETYTFGNGDTTLLFVGGVHGGYEWNSTLLAYQFIDELENERIEIPSSLTIEIIPTLNPDGLYKVVGKEGRFTTQDVSSDSEVTTSGRFNANNVDLNRNFDCKWQPTSTWRNKIVSAGDKAFSEPEALTLKNFVSETNPSAVIFWHSQADTVYASECEQGILPETLTLMNTYADAASYKKVASFDAYPVSGDAEGWLASINIPAITVELSSHTTMDWSRNLEGFEAVIDLYQTPR